MILGAMILGASWAPPWPDLRGLSIVARECIPAAPGVEFYNCQPDINGLRRIRPALTALGYSAVPTAPIVQQRQDPR